jgi:hypothetical protein
VRGGVKSEGVGDSKEGSEEIAKRHVIKYRRSGKIANTER